MVCEDTLKIKNLPAQLSEAEKEDFLRHFGATNVKLITSQQRGKTVAFAKFESKEKAKALLHRLHQLNVLNSRLFVEYAEHDIGHGNLILKTSENSNSTDTKKQYKAFISKLNAWNNSVSFHQPPPAHLKYVYPKANRATINNIAHALASVPKFYTQVLHLMNKMNLPPPFSNVPDPPVTSLRQPATKQMDTSQEHQPSEAVEESEESELESDPDVGKSKDIIPLKRKMPQKKAIKRPKFIKPQVQLTNNLENKSTTEDLDKVFEKSTLMQQKKIELKVTSETLNDNIKDDQVIVEEETEVIGDKVANSVITEEELEHNRIPLKDLSVLSVFKEYHPGIPSAKLYIKNIAKTVQKSDLEHIYKRYVENAEKTIFEIKLMQEGRMKGQAFVTLDNVQLAQKAVKETNGFILKDKPLVVVYAKSNSKK